MINKISGIIPANSRVKSVDLTSAHPVRAGAPDPFKIGSGREQKDRIAFSESLLTNPSTYSSSGRMKSDDFFINRLKPTEIPTLSEVQNEVQEEFQTPQEMQPHEDPTVS